MSVKMHKTFNFQPLKHPTEYLRHDGALLFLFGLLIRVDLFDIFQNNFCHNGISSSIRSGFRKIAGVQRAIAADGEHQGRVRGRVQLRKAGAVGKIKLGTALF